MVFLALFLLIFIYFCSFQLMSFGNMLAIEGELKMFFLGQSPVQSCQIYRIQLQLVLFHLIQ